MIKATRNGIAGIFSDNDWKSGQPQRYGWQEEGKEGKTLPKEIIEFVTRRRAPEKAPEFEPIEVTLTWPKELTPEKPTDPLKDEPIIQVTEKVKTKKNDNPKQKVGRTAKRKPRGVAKA